MKGDHALALTAYVVLAVAVIGVSVDHFETNQASSPRSASSVATPEGAADGGPRVAPGEKGRQATRDETGQADEGSDPQVEDPVAAEPVPSGSAASEVVAPGAQPRPPSEVSDSTSTAPAPESPATQPGDPGSTVPCPGDDSVLVTPVPSGDLCPTPVPTEEGPLEGLDPLLPIDRLDLPDLGFGSTVATGSEG